MCIILHVDRPNPTLPDRWTFQANWKDESQPDKNLKLEIAARSPDGKRIFDVLDLQTAESPDLYQMALERLVAKVVESEKAAAREEERSRERAERLERIRASVPVVTTQPSYNTREVRRQRRTNAVDADS